MTRTRRAKDLGVGDGWFDQYRWRGTVSTSTVVGVHSPFWARRRFERKLKDLAATYDVDIDIRGFRGFFSNAYLVSVCGPERNVKVYVQILRS